MKSVEHIIPNGDGWHLSLFQTWHETLVRKDRPPVLIVPGYAMNSFIFSYHPHGASLEGYLAQAGFEVWRVDLRAQGRSVSIGGGDDYSLEDLATTDLTAAIEAALERTQCEPKHVDVIGASLGGTIVLLHTALKPDHRIGSIVAMGSPVRWVEIHPIIKLAFASPALVGMLRISGTRKIAKLALPHMVKRTPWLLSIYMNPSITDTRAASEMVKTVEDPNRHVNKQIAHWIRDRDLVVRDVNLSDAVRELDHPLLCISAKGDGIVPMATAQYPFLVAASKVKKMVEVGTDQLAMAHADLFVSSEAEARVFEPIASWLAHPTS